jgi:DNA-binding IclR family transcriptional regulator
MGSTATKFLRGLEWLCQRDAPAGVTEMSVALRVSKSNAHRILSTLTALGYARNDTDGRYAATLKTWEVGSTVLNRLDIKELARPLMLELSRKTEETVHLSILDGAEVIYIDKVESNQPIRAYSRVGGRAPAYAVATGKALLAFAEGALQDSVPTKLTTFTKATITNRADLMKEFERIRQKGFAVNTGEWREGMHGVGAPIRNERNDVVGAIGISGPASRLAPDRLRAFAPSVMEVAARISTQLGHRPPSAPNGKLSSPTKSQATARKYATRRATA